MGAGLSQEEAAQPQEEAAPRKSCDPPRKTLTDNFRNNSIAQTGTQMKFPHNYEAILKDADSPINKSSVVKLYDQLYTSVFLNRTKRGRYWIDRNSHNNCFLVFVRDLVITWADDSRFWHWPNFKETSHEFIDAAEMLNVCWLEVHGKFETTMLTPRINYEVLFVVMLKDPAYGWEVPVNVRLNLPDGSKQEHKEDLMEKARGRWIKIPTGKFIVSPEKVGFIEFSLYDYEGGAWKRDLVIKGVSIRQKTLGSSRTSSTLPSTVSYLFSWL